jgi:hypothetical protein
MHIKKSELVGAIGVVTSGEFDRVTRIAQIQKVDTLDYAPVGDVEAGNYTDRERH